MSESVRLTIAEARALCENAAIGAGARPETARSIADAAVAAEAAGQALVGLAHFVDYLDALREGRIDGRALPEITRPAPALFLSEANGGAAQTGFDQCFDAFADTARLLGIALFSQRNAYTAGALGYYAGRLAEAGLVAFAAANGPPLLAPEGVATPVYCTNPLAFAAPVEGGPPLLIDQSSSATAFVNIRAAAETGAAIPDGWAVDGAGRPTTDPREAMKGALVAFGGSRGANIALMVEVLSAGLAGANWSLDAPSFSSGNRSPRSGLFVLAIQPAMLDADFAARLAVQLDRLAALGVHIPGRAKAEARARAEREGVVIPAGLFAQIVRGPG
jgi:(2R)-3-sulfolactate dehydrogenase (NADP+)